MLGVVSERDFLEPAAKGRTADVIRAVEAQTAVEVVVAVRRRASHHFGTSLAFGLATAVVVFAVMWLSPTVYDVRTMPLDAAVAFVLGTAVAASVPSLRKVLTPPGFRTRSVERAAREAFETLGIEKTSGRTGLLVFVALFEGKAVLVPDSGIPAATVTGPLASIRELLSAATARSDLDGFLTALSSLGPTCAAVLPRQADDENELCDDVA
jgi:putative membrane protein